MPSDRYNFPPSDLIPVLHQCCPSGLTEYISTMLRVSNTYLEIDIVVHEFSMQAVPPEVTSPICVNK